MRLVLWIAACLLLLGLAAGATPPAPPRTLAFAVDAVERGTCAPPVVDDLRRLSQDASPTGPRAAYLLGHCLWALGTPAEARNAFEQSAAGHPTLAGHARLQAAGIALELGDLDGALRVLSPLPSNASRVIIRRAALLRGDALLRAGRPAEALVALRAFPRLDSADDETQVQVWWLRARGAEQAGDRRTAMDAYAMVWWAFPGNPHEEEAGVELRRLSGRESPPVPAIARVERGQRLLQQGEPKAAERELTLAVRGTLPDEVAATAWYQLGQLRLGTRAAVDAFTRASRSPRLRERAQYYLGSAYNSIGRRGDALAVWERLAAQRPPSPWAARAFLSLGRGAEAREQWGEADRWHARAAEVAPEAPSADEARWRRGWIRYRTGRYAEAERLFLQYGRAYPRTARAAANLYWAGRARQEQKQDATALFRTVAETYPLTFYGQRARTRVGAPPPAKRPPAGERELPADIFAETYMELAGLGFAREAAEEVDALRAADDSAEWLRTAAELRTRAGDLQEAVGAAEPLITPALYGTRTADAGAWSLAYPRAFWSELSIMAERYGVDPYLALAVMREESRFDPEAVSPARAIGLMQLLPQTAQGILGGRVTPSRLMNPQLNIRAGVAYLGGLLRRYDGSAPLAVAAYNSGPGGVSRVRALAGTDLDRFVESLPYAETRAYTQRVLQSYGIYRWLYE